MPCIIEAHRGDSANAPENTLAAFQRAIGLGAAWIELDVHPSLDGELMVIHDDTVDRTTNGSGAVGQMPAAALASLDAGAWFAPPFAGERIPRLVEVLELVVPTQTRLNVEIKASPPGLPVDVPHQIVDLFRHFGLERQCVVSSFDLAALLRVRARAPEIPLALIGNGPEILPLACRHRLPWVHANHQTLNRALVDQAHHHGLRVNTWTVDDPATLPTWNGMGVDKLCTNCPALMLAAQRQGQIS